jgi:hypothetical protein
VKPIALYAAAMTVCVSAAGALTPNAPRQLAQSLFDLNLAFALVVFASVWLSTPRGPDALHA